MSKYPVLVCSLLAIVMMASTALTIYYEPGPMWRVVVVLFGMGVVFFLGQIVGFTAAGRRGG